MYRKYRSIKKYRYIENIDISKISIRQKYRYIENINVSEISIY